MLVWFICQSSSDIESGDHKDFIMFSTQEKAEEKFMELVDTEKDLFGNEHHWDLDDAPWNKNFRAKGYCSECSDEELYVGSYELDKMNTLY